MGIKLESLRLKVSVPKPKRKQNEGIVRTTNKIVRGTVSIDENGVYKISIPMNKNTINPDLRVLEFTERSYDLTGKAEVFRRKQEKGRWVRVIRDAFRVKFMPGLQEQYVPFAPKWIVKGYIVKDNGLTKFDFKGLVTLEGYDIFVITDEND